MENKKQVVMVSASPKVKEKAAVSTFLSKLGKEILRDKELQVARIDVRKSILKKNTEHDYETMLKAGAIIFVFPLYIFCLPGLLTRFLQDFVHYCKAKEKGDLAADVYTVVNCGFPEADINEEAIRVIKSFSRQVGASFRFGVSLGGGGMLLSTRNAFFMKKTMRSIAEAFAKIGEDIKHPAPGAVDDIYIEPGFPRWLYYYAGNKGWVMAARRRQIEKKELYKKPYQAAP